MTTRRTTLTRTPREDVLPPFVAWAAQAGVAAPLLALFAIVVGVPLYTEPMRVAAATTRLVVANAATLGVLLLLAITLVGLHLQAVDRLGRLGQVAFVAALTGTVLAAGGAWDSVFALPYIAQQAPAVLDVPTSGTLLAGFVISYLVLVVGWAVFAVAARRSGVISRVPAVTLALGALVAIVPAPTALRLLPLAVGVALAGRAVLRSSRDA
jgi:hypothetical protein